MKRATLLWALAAALGLAMTAAVTWASSLLVTQSIGITAAPAAALTRLAPKLAVATSTTSTTTTVTRTVTTPVRIVTVRTRTVTVGTPPPPPAVTHTVTAPPVVTHTVTAPPVVTHTTTTATTQKPVVKPTGSQPRTSVTSTHTTSTRHHGSAGGDGSASRDD